MSWKPPSERTQRDRGAGRIPSAGPTRRSVLAATVAAVGVGAVLSRSGPAPAGFPPLWSRCSFGAYAHNAPSPDITPHLALEELVGAPLPRMTWFADMDVPWLGDRAAEAAAAGRHDLCLSWEPRAAGVPIPFDDLLSGAWDARLRTFFARAAQYPHRVIMRPFWEMNAGVGAYSLDYGGITRQVRDPDQFRAVWRRLVGLQRAVGGERISWFFCANGTDVGKVPMEQYWPGSDYVDEMGFDTYNDDFSPWASFTAKVRPMYDRLLRLSPTAPVSIGETGSRETGAPPGASKARWVADLFECTEFPRLTHVSFFHSKPSEPWRLDTSADSLAVHRHYLRLAAADPQPG